MRAFKDEGFDWDEAVAVLEKYAAEGFNHFNVTGGEPTLFKQLPELLKLAQSLGYTTYMASNGSRTKKPEYFARIAPVLDEMCFSVHGADAATHDALTGLPGSYDGLMQSFDYAAKAGLRLFYNIVAVRSNAEQIPDIVAAGRQRGSGGDSDIQPGSRGDWAGSIHGPVYSSRSVARNCNGGKKSRGRYVCGAAVFRGAGMRPWQRPHHEQRFVF